ncbi:Glia maturation factor beta [Lachnellula subtilissima]|uniref:Glia maturation factor beta n=1 Tax=Lachnellula subtilissima TaxID=602034 RepID=A0A8H8RHF4_9HELO|nr:Glia maturation factor beta [Lachnellula subtilissima]
MVQPACSAMKRMKLISPSLPNPDSTPSLKRAKTTCESSAWVPPAQMTHKPSADMIDKHTLEIKQDEDKTVYTNLEDIADDLPDHSPRFVLLSYPLTLPSGRMSVPYVLLYYLPVTCNAELRMLYAGAKELMRNTAEVGKVIEIDSADDLEELPAKLGAA